MSTILAKMAVQIQANTAEFNKGMNSASASLQGFTKVVSNMSATIASAFIVKQIASFVGEINKLAGRFEGVQRAFDRLPNSTLLMDKLQESTHGTVDQLTLMQQALRAKNFGISVKDLGTYLEFAAIRAQQTGESIDYMVNSIILGLGRGSIKILDNLQVNIAKIKETVKETGVSLQEAFRQQVVEQMKNIGGYADTAETSVNRFEVAVKSLRVELSKKLQSSWLIDMFSGGIQGISNLVSTGSISPRFKKLQEEAVKIVRSTTDTLKGSAQEQQDIIQQEINTLVQLIGRRNDEIKRLEEERIKILDRLRKQGGHTASEFAANLPGNKVQNLVTDAMLEAPSKQIESMNDSITRMRVMIDLYKEYFNTISTGSQDVGKQLGIEEKLRQEIEDTEFLRSKATTKQDVDEYVAILKKLNDELDTLLGKKKKVDDSFRGLKMELIPEENQGSRGISEGEIRNSQAQIEAATFSKELMDIGKSAEFAGGALIKLNETTTTSVGNLKKYVMDISGIIEGGIVGIADALGRATVEGFGDFGKSFLRAFGGFAQQFGSLLIATGVAEIALKSGNPIAMIAAGAALVALGGAMAALSADKPSLSKGGGGRSSSQQYYRPSVQNSGFGDLNITGRLVAEGSNLVAVLENANRDNRSRKA